MHVHKLTSVASYEYQTGVAAFASHSKHEERAKNDIYSRTAAAAATTTPFSEWFIHYV